MRIGHIAVLARTARGQAPQHRAVIDVEHAHHAVAGGVFQSLLRCGAGAGCGQVRAGNGQRAAAGDKALVNGLGVDRHIGAVFAHEQQGKGVAVFEAQEHQRGQALRVDLHLAGVAAFALQGLQQKAAHLLIAHPRHHGALEAQPRHAEGQVGRTAAQVLRHAAVVFQRAAELLGIKVHRQPTQACEVKVPVSGEGQNAHRFFPWNCVRCVG